VLTDSSKFCRLDGRFVGKIFRLEEVLYENAILVFISKIPIKLKIDIYTITRKEHKAFILNSLFIIKKILTFNFIHVKATLNLKKKVFF
tara:strand:- start:625 stop:891 length:267 start_codon:yes stop_codon:yes gene_type:complete